MGTVIKAGSAAKLMKRFETLALKDHMAEAHAVVQSAHRHKARLIEGAQAEGDKIRTEADGRGYEDGFARGRREGEESGRKKAYADAKQGFLTEQAQLLSTVGALVAGLESMKENLMDQAQRDLLVFAVAVAERITKSTGLLDRQVVVANAKEAIRQIGARTDLVARANPVDLDALRKYAAELSSELGEESHFQLIEDANIEPGGCIVSSATSRVDATLSGQFEQAAAILLGDETKQDGNEQESDRP